MIPVDLTQDMVRDIGVIGYLRYPNEACGILLPEPWRGRQVLELPNRHPRPKDKFEIHTTDIELMLEGWDGDPSLISIWHTHPSGHEGPSAFDVKHRVEQLGNLVVSLNGEGRAIGHWY